MLNYCYSDCCFAEYCYSDCCFAEYCYSECHYADYCYSECRFVECHHAQHCYSNCMVMPNAVMVGVVYLSMLSVVTLIVVIMSCNYFHYVVS
jgi:hypothetical protein